MSFSSNRQQPSPWQNGCACSPLVHMHDMQRKHSLSSPTSLCSCLRINTSIFFFPEQTNKRRNPGWESLHFKHIHTSVHAGGGLGFEFSSQLTPRQAVDDGFVSFFFFSFFLPFPESDGVRRERVNLEAAAACFFFCPTPWHVQNSEYSTVSFPLSWTPPATRVTTITRRKWMESQMNLGFVVYSS